MPVSLTHISEKPLRHAIQFLRFHFLGMVPPPPPLVAPPPPVSSFLSPIFVTELLPLELGSFHCPVTYCSVARASASWWRSERQGCPKHRAPWQDPSQRLVVASQKEYRWQVTEHFNPTEGRTGRYGMDQRPSCCHRMGLAMELN